MQLLPGGSTRHQSPPLRCLRSIAPPGLLAREWRVLAVRLPGRTEWRGIMNPRLRRLENDYRDLRLEFDADPHLVIRAVPPLPPEQYVITYSVPSLARTADNRLFATSQTIVTITLPHGYPREKPQAVTEDPVFHPNFGAYICIADFWAPGQSLSDIVRSIGDMLQFKKYNIRSPLNAVAAEWANTNAHALPIGTISLGARAADVNVQVDPIEVDLRSVVTDTERGAGAYDPELGGDRYV